MSAHMHGPFDGIPTLALLFAGLVITCLVLAFGAFFYLIAKLVIVALLLTQGTAFKGFDRAVA